MKHCIDVIWMEGFVKKRPGAPAKRFARQRFIPLCRYHDDLDIRIMRMKLIERIEAIQSRHIAIEKNNFERSGSTKGESRVSIHRFLDHYTEHTPIKHSVK